MADPPQQPGQEPTDDDSLDGGQGQEPGQQADDDESLGGLPANAQDEIRKLRAEAKRHRLTARESQARVKELEDRDKTEEQRRQDELVAASTRAQHAETRLLRYEVAAELGISQHAGRLQGDTREELVEDAKKLAREFGLDTQSSRPNSSSGVRRPVQRPQTMNDLIRQAAGR